MSNKFIKAIQVQNDMHKYFTGKRPTNKSVLNEEQRIKIRALYKGGMKESVIAHYLNLEVMTVLNNLRSIKGRKDYESRRAKLRTTTQIASHSIPARV